MQQKNAFKDICKVLHDTNYCHSLLVGKQFSKKVLAKRINATVFHSSCRLNNCLIALNLHLQYKLINKHYSFNFVIRFYTKFYLLMLNYDRSLWFDINSRFSIRDLFSYTLYSDNRK